MLQLFTCLIFAVALQAEAGTVRGSKPETLDPTETVTFETRHRYNATAAVSFGKLDIPAAFNQTQAQAAGTCASPFVAAGHMYLTPSGSSLTSGQWGEWRLAEDPDSIVPSKWHLDFLAWNWQVIHVTNTADGSASVMASPISEDHLKKLYNWTASDKNSADHRWDFLREWFAPNVAFWFDQQPYRFGMANATYPTTFTAAPSAQASALPYPTWSHWSLTDCKDNLVAVVRAENTDAQQAGKMLVFNSVGELAAVALPDPILARYQFIDVNGYLLATAEAPTLNANITYKELPRREDLGYVVPYTMHWELGGYNMSSDLIREDSRWILSLAIQVRALQDAHQNFIPPLVKDRFLLFAVAAAVILSGCLLAFLVCVGVTPEIYSIFFPSRVKAMPGFQAAPMPAETKYNTF